MLWFHEINKKMVIKRGIGAGLAEVAYCLLVALVMSNLAQNSFVQSAFWGFAFVLVLLVFSVAISGSFVFGFPAYLALQKKYKEAILVLLVTFLTLLGGFVSIVAIAMLFFSNINY